MSKILLTWELGDHLGHLLRLKPVTERLARRGHTVVMAVCKLPRKGVLMEEVEVVPIPDFAARPDFPITPPCTFADILFNDGAGDPAQLAIRTEYWHEIIDARQPDILVMDYSPFALLAAQGRSVKKVLLGTGFACPSENPTLPDMRAWENHYPDRIRMTEQQVVDGLNVALESLQQPPITSIGTLYGRVDLNLLATYRELDHYPDRTTGQYVGSWGNSGGEKVDWPGQTEPRVFAYLKPFPAIRRLLDHLAESDYNTVAYLPEMDDDFKACYRESSLRIVCKPVDIDWATRECHFAILNGGHGTTLAMLLAGKPLLQIPLQVEQYLTALAVEKMGAGIHASGDSVSAVIEGVEALRTADRFRSAAADFAGTYVGHTADESIARVLKEIESL